MLEIGLHVCAKQFITEKHDESHSHSLETYTHPLHRQTSKSLAHKPIHTYSGFNSDGNVRAGRDLYRRLKYLSQKRL